MAQSTVQAIGAAAQPWASNPKGEFHPNTGEYEAIPRGKSAFAFDAKTLNTQAALHGALALGGGVLPQNMGMMAGILPAALKIQEHQQMQEVAEKYYEKYIKDFNRKYGFTEDQIKDLVQEFKLVTEEITRLIPDDKMKEMYKKYIESYPTMYLSMIPAEALQTKLAVKCVTDNKILREKIEEMSTCVSTLVRGLTDLQISAGIPPIVNLMFESMPDPLTAITDPMYTKYNEAIVTYHNLLQDTKSPGTLARINSTDPALKDRAEFLRLEPVQYLEGLIAEIGTDDKYDVRDNQGNITEVSKSKIQDLATVMKNMQTQSGCQPFGDEWNHTGPEPAMNPALCLAPPDNFQPGNPRHNIGRTNVYQAKRDASGNARWVQSGTIPAVSAGGPQMVQHTPQPMQNANQWAGYSHMPGVDPRPPTRSRSHHPAMQQAPMPNFNTAYPGAVPPSRMPKGSKSKKAAKSSKGSKGSKGSKSKKQRASAP